MPPRVGVLLAGCGRYDGSEVQETVLMLLALERRAARAECLAPDRAQLDVVDHASSRVEEEAAARNILTESCRLVRGRVTPLGEARPDTLDALLLPGGHGAVKNWMSGFARPGEPRAPRPDVRGLLENLLQRRRPIGVVSLADSLISALCDEPLREDPFSIPATEAVVNEARNVVYTPGFMASERLGEVAAGIEKMVEMVLARAGGAR